MALTPLASSLGRPTSWLAEDNCTGQTWLDHGHLSFPVNREGCCCASGTVQVKLMFCC